MGSEEKRIAHRRDVAELGRAPVRHLDQLARAKYPWLDMQTLYPFSEEGIGRAVADAMAMKTVKSTIVPWPDLVQ
jgi:hypothetical protein